MNKYFFTVLLSVVLTANNVQAQFIFGVRAGVNSAKICGGIGAATKMKLGFQIGAVADYSVSNKLSIEPGFFFATLGHKMIGSSTTQGGEQITNRCFVTPNYIQFPVHARYKFENKLILQAGPYLGFAVGGKVREKIGRTGNVFEHKLKFGGDDYRIFDCGFGIGVAMQFSNIQIGLEGKQGFIGVKPSMHETLSYSKNVSLSLTATYMLGK